MLIPSITSAAAHKHSHGKERLEDGAFSPKDHDHFEGGINDYIMSTLR